MSESMWVLYVLECVDASYYTGITNDLARRMAQHQAGTGAKYTRGRGPFALKYTETYATRSEASKREYAIKQLSKVEKEKLFNH